MIRGYLVKSEKSLDLLISHLVWDRMCGFHSEAGITARPVG